MERGTTGAALWTFYRDPKVRKDLGTGQDGWLPRQCNDFAKQVLPVPCLEIRAFLKTLLRSFRDFLLCSREHVVEVLLSWGPL